jgi:hypothetical protein
MGNVAWKEEVMVWKFLVKIYNGKGRFGREDNIKRKVIGVGCEGIDFLNVLYRRVRTCCFFFWKDYGEMAGTIKCVELWTS